MITVVEKTREHRAACSGFFSSSIEDDDHDALWLACDDFRQHEAHALSCAVIVCDGYIVTKLSSIGRHTARLRQGGKVCGRLS